MYTEFPRNFQGGLHGHTPFDNQHRFCIKFSFAYGQYPGVLAVIESVLHTHAICRSTHSDRISSSHHNSFKSSALIWYYQKRYEVQASLELLENGRSLRKCLACG